MVTNTLNNIFESFTLTAHCGATLPAGTGAVVGAFAQHRSEAVWGPNANGFDPDRFLPERSANRHPAAFLPFSYGSRNCIGKYVDIIPLFVDLDYTSRFGYLNINKEYT